jgi:hypothetical protein
MYAMAEWVHNGGLPHVLHLILQEMVDSVSKLSDFFGDRVYVNEEIVPMLVKTHERMIIDCDAMECIVDSFEFYFILATDSAFDDSVQLQICQTFLRLVEQRFSTLLFSDVLGADKQYSEIV